MYVAVKAGMQDARSLVGWGVDRLTLKINVRSLDNEWGPIRLRPDPELEYVFRRFVQKIFERSILNVS